MPRTSTSSYVDISACTYGGVPIFGITSIKISRRDVLLKVRDNNQLRPTASHRTSLEETVTISSKDITAMIAVRAQSATTPANSLVFTAVPAEQNIAGVDAAKTVTVQNLFIEDEGVDYTSHGEAMYHITGTVIGVSGGTDPITYV